MSRRSRPLVVTVLPHEGPVPEHAGERRITVGTEAVPPAGSYVLLPWPAAQGRRMDNVIELIAFVLEVEHQPLTDRIHAELVKVLLAMKPELASEYRPQRASEGDQAWREAMAEGAVRQKRAGSNS